MDVPSSVNIPSNIPPAPAPKRSSALLSVVALLVVAIVGGVYYWWHGHNSPASSQLNVTLTSQAGTGKLVPGFPRDLIFGKDAQIVDSRTLSVVKTATGTQMILARYTTSLSRDVIYNAYVGYANDRHYPIQHSQNGTSSASVVFGDPDITVASIVSRGNITDVAVTVNKNVALPTNPTATQ